MTSPLKVAHLTQYFAVGGIERMIQSLAEAHRARGVGTAVAAYLGDGPVRPALRRLGASTALLPGRDGLDPLLPFRIARWLRAERADVLHTHNLGPFIYGAAGARLAGVPQVHTEHSHAIYSSARRRALARRMDGLAAVVAVSEEVAAWRGCFAGRRCPVIPNGVAVPGPVTAAARQAARRALGAAEGEFVVGCVARLAEVKDHATLVRAVGVARRRVPSMSLVLVGEGPLRRPLERIALQAGLGGAARFLGGRDDVAALLPGLDLFALTSRHEGLPLAVLEALAAGIPAVTTAVGELPRLLGGGAGDTVPAGDVLALSDALVRAAGSPAWWAAASLAGRRLVAERYSVDAMADGYLTLYRAAARARRAA